MDMISFSVLCNNCGQYWEFHNQKQKENCRAITKEKSGNLDKWCHE